MKAKIFLGVDAGKSDHAVAALDERDQVVWEARIKNTHEGFTPLLEKIQEWQEEGIEIWVGAEGIGGYLSPLDVHLCACECKYVNIQPKQYQLFREMMEWQPEKSDERDARGLAAFLHWQVEKDKARVREGGNDYYETLRTTARAFNQTLQSKVAMQNQLVSAAREYWPELFLENYFSKTDAQGLLALLQACPTPQAVAKAGVRRVNKVLSEATQRDQKELAERLVNEARRLAPQTPVSAAKASVVQALAAGVCHLTRVLAELEKQMKEQLQNHPFGRWLLDQKGFGVRTAGGFLGEAGNLDRFENDAQLARYAGNGAVLNQSGKSEGRHWDAHRYNHRLKRVVLLMAESRARYHDDSITYVATRKEAGGEYWKIIKKLARFLIRFLWKGWQEVCAREKVLADAARPT